MSSRPDLLCSCRRRTMTHAPAERRTTRTNALTAMPEMRGALRSDDESEATTVITAGAFSTATPSAVEAASAVPRLEESEVCTWSAVLEAGTAMVAVMRTLAATTRIVTSDLSTPAASATFCCKLDLSLSERSLTLPLAVSVSTTVPVEGGGGGSEGEGDGGGGNGNGEGGGGEGEGSAVDGAAGGACAHDSKLGAAPTAVAARWHSR